jgi:short-subunit dehydrogenase
MNNSVYVIEEEIKELEEKRVRDVFEINVFATINMTEYLCFFTQASYFAYPSTSMMASAKAFGAS